MRPRAGNTRPYGIPEPLVYSVGADDSAARTFTEISRHRRAADEDIRPYGKYGSPVHFIAADDSAARLLMEDSPLPMGGTTPSPTVSSKASIYFVGTKHRARGENSVGRPSVPLLRICLGLPHLIVGAHIMRPRAGNTRPHGIPEPLVYSVGADDSAARTFTEISRHRRADEDIRPYGKYGSPVHFIAADDSAARLFMEDSPLPMGGTHPRVASLGLRPIHLQPLPCRVLKRSHISRRGQAQPFTGRLCFYFSAAKAWFLLTTNFCKCRILLEVLQMQKFGGDCYEGPPPSA